MRPVCVKCERFFRPKKNGYAFEEGIPAIKTDDEEARWQDPQPYKLWSGDLYECPQCKTEIIVGFGLRPIAEHYQKDYAAAVKANKSTILVLE